MIRYLAFGVEGKGSKGGLQHAVIPARAKGIVLVVFGSLQTGRRGILSERLELADPVAFRLAEVVAKPFVEQAHHDDAVLAVDFEGDSEIPARHQGDQGLRARHRATELEELENLDRAAGD